MIAEVMGLGAALIISIRLFDRIQAYEHRLLDYATDKLSQIPGLRIIGQADQKGSDQLRGRWNPFLDIGTLLI